MGGCSSYERPLQHERPLQDRRPFQELLTEEQFKKYLDLVLENPTSGRCHAALSSLLFCVDVGKDPFMLGKVHADAIGTVMAIGLTHFQQWLFKDLVASYYPDKVYEMFETFTKVKGLDQNKFFENIFPRFEELLHDRLQVMSDVVSGGLRHPMMYMRISGGHRHVCPGNGEKTCLFWEFVSLVLSACRPLHYDSGPVMVYQGPDPPPKDAKHYPLFAKAVKHDLLEEAILLYETGAVNLSELAILAQEEKIKKMLDGDKNTPMATFLRSVVRQPRSLLSSATLEVSRLLGHDPRSRQNRTRSLGLPKLLYNEVLFIRQESDYRHAVQLRSG